MHVCVEVPEHCLVPGTHAPAQTPELQTFAQGEPLFCHAPVESQSCGCWPMHCTAPGVQVPVHTPLVHRYGQGPPAGCHWPLTHV